MFAANTHFPLIKAPERTRQPVHRVTRAVKHTAGLQQKTALDHKLDEQAGRVLRHGAERSAWQTAVAHQFSYKKPIPCLLPTNNFIARSQKREEAHLKRSSLGFARALARSSATGMSEFKMSFEPQVKFHFEEDEVDEEADKAHQVSAPICLQSSFFFARVVLPTGRYHEAKETDVEIVCKHSYGCPFHTHDAAKRAKQSLYSTDSWQWSTCCGFRKSTSKLETLSDKSSRNQSTWLTWK
jgi:hypothetical protein